MLCEVCRESEAVERPTGYQGHLLCERCLGLARVLDGGLADVPGPPESVDHDAALDWARKYVAHMTDCTILPKSRNMAAAYIELRDMLETAIVRLENAAGPYHRELHRDAAALRRRLREGRRDDGLP